jgi:uncharacterized coiled-coil protein SlyX
MDFDQWLDVITILFGAGGVASFLLSIKRSKSQNTLDLSSAWEKFAAPLMERVTYLETRTHEQDAEICALNEKVTDQETEIEDLRGWAERLVRQIIDLGGTPVVFVKRNRHKENKGSD